MGGVRVEIETLNECYDATQGADSTEALLELCQRKIANVQPAQSGRKIIGRPGAAR